MPEKAEPEQVERDKICDKVSVRLDHESSSKQSLEQRSITSSLDSAFKL